MLSAGGRWVMVVAFVVSTACGSGTADDPPPMTGLEFPAEIGAWAASGASAHHDSESIYAYINGHAEVYMAYGFRRAASQRYVGPEGDEIVVDLFEVASPADAFGVFSHDRAGEPVEVGNGGVYRHGWVSFWRGSWAGSLYWDGVREPDREAMLQLGSAAAAMLPRGGEVPALVSRLPEDGLDPSSVCFLRSPQILNAHLYVGAGNPFSLGPEHEAVIGRYDLEGGPVDLLLIRYDGESTASEVETELRAATSDMPPMTVGRTGNLVAVAVGEVADEDGAELLEAVLGGAA